MAYPPASGAHLLFSTPYHPGAQPAFIESTLPFQPAEGPRPRPAPVRRTVPTPPSHNYKTGFLSFHPSSSSRPDTLAHTVSHLTINPITTATDATHPSPAPSKTASTTTASSSSSSTTPVTPLSLLGSWSSTHSSSSSMPNPLMQVKDQDGQVHEPQAVARGQHSYGFQSPHIGAVVSNDTETSQEATQPLDLLSSVDGPWAPEAFNEVVSVPSPSPKMDAGRHSFGGHSRSATHTASGFASYEGNNLELSFGDSKASLSHLTNNLNAFGSAADQALQKQTAALANEEVQPGQQSQPPQTGEHMHNRHASFPELSTANNTPWTAPQAIVSNSQQDPILGSPTARRNHASGSAFSSRPTIGVDRTMPSGSHGHMRSVPYPARPPHRPLISEHSNGRFVGEAAPLEDRGDGSANSFSTASHHRMDNYYTVPSGSAAGNQPYYTGLSAYAYGAHESSQQPRLPGVGAHNQAYVYGNSAGAAPALGQGYTYDSAGGPMRQDYQNHGGRGSGNGTDFDVSTPAASQRRITGSVLPDTGGWLPPTAPAQPGPSQPRPSQLGPVSRLSSHSTHGQSQNNYSFSQHQYSSQSGLPGLDPQYGSLVQYNPHREQSIDQVQPSGSLQDAYRQQAMLAHDPELMTTTMGSSVRIHNNPASFFRRSSDQRMVSVSADGGANAQLVRAPQDPFPNDLAAGAAGMTNNNLDSAAVSCHSDLMELAHSWDDDEYQRKRRLVQFWRFQAGPYIHVTAKPIPHSQYNSANIVVSCIFREDKNDCFITSVDTIALLESLIGLRFSIEEKNRIRRNLEGFRPLTVSKNKRETASFFALIMGFPEPKPRNIEKDVKVFAWSTLSDALKKIISKYNVQLDLQTGLS